LYGLLTRREVGRRLNLSEWQVERIERRAILKFMAGMLEVGFTPEQILSTLNPAVWDSRLTYRIRVSQRQGSEDE
jgi:hypothetical protein